MSSKHQGISKSYLRGRTLTEQEKRERLYQGQPHPDNPLINDHDTVIKMNSTYLETVDRSYNNKGFLSLICFGITITFLCIMIWGCQGTIEAHRLRNESLSSKAIYALLFLNGIVCLIIFICVKLILIEWFRKTHYPIRFNRKKQMVYVYQIDGSVLSAPWGNIFFTLNGGNKWGINGHILADDNQTVLQTFNLAILESKPNLPNYWEFIRCYMEEDVLHEIPKTIFLCPPIAERKEGYLFGLQYGIRMRTKIDWVLLLPLFPYYLVEAFSRYIGMQTSRIPQWPKEVEMACQVDSDDPIDVSYKGNIPYVWRYVFANLKMKDRIKYYKQSMTASKRIRRKVARRHKEQ
ncbi:hypothetical protein Xsto_00598 [Xenorhabdus stockiae]|uniref:DUF6708 domain-containing protein n=1 Tax=Xenorhabdus stockiae TaxID=351614 RepID=A0A2D0KU14_9GAMM|nr:DUF6708 domain-containing protein [Xenorhabdus stockiae]PHM66946.1 hypothetical protein Xsto_00598 [Xenorhabdus stockiae]